MSNEMEWKQALFSRAVDLGLIDDHKLIEQLDEPVPLWIVLKLLVDMKERLDPPSRIYD